MSRDKYVTQIISFLRFQSNHLQYSMYDILINMRLVGLKEIKSDFLKFCTHIKYITNNT